LRKPIDIGGHSDQHMSTQTTRTMKQNRHLNTIMQRRSSSKPEKIRNDALISKYNHIHANAQTVKAIYTVINNHQENTNLSEKSAAIRIQRHWRIVTRLRQVRYHSHQVHGRVNSIIRYIVFLAAYLYSTILPLSESDNYHFVNNLKGQLAEVEFNAEDSPTWGKNFFDIATVQEVNHWLRGPLTTFIASYGTYNGNNNIEENEVDTTSYALGIGRILGGIRIGQLRGQRVLCGDLKFAFTFGSSLDNDPAIEKLHCYPEFKEGVNENKETFNTFEWEGWNGTNTQRERDGFFTSETVQQSYRSYPSPAYSVVLSPTNWTETKNMIKYIQDNYIDLYTKALFIDVLVLNPTLDYIVNCRMVIQFTSSGGAMPTFTSKSVRSSPIPFTGGWDIAASICELVIIAYYLFFFIEEVLHIKTYGIHDYIETAGLAKYIHILNIFLFGVVWCYKIIAVLHIPKEAQNVRSDQWLEMRSYIETYVIARYISAINAFLTWFKLIALLDISPTFALVTRTLSKSASKVAGFAVVFFILLISFAFMFMVSFSTVLSQYSTAARSGISLLRALLGDIDYHELRDAHWLMGPGLFFVYITINVFVVLNMLIAIISDAYSEVSQDIKQMPNVKLGREMMQVLNHKLLKIPGVKKSISCFNDWKKRSKNNTNSIRSKHHDHSRSPGTGAAQTLTHHADQGPFELEKKKRKEEKETKLQNDMEESKAGIKQIKRMHKRLIRIEQMMCKIVGIPYKEENPEDETKE
jgi:hypothetical protein